MATFMGGAAIALLAAVGAYVFRGRETRREHRLTIYSEFVAAFLDASSAGAGLGSAYMYYGEKLWLEDNRERVRPFWEAWEASGPAFTRAATRMRFVASDKLRARAEELEEFVDKNIRAAPPLNPDLNDRSAWGESIKVGPARVAADSHALARAFAEAARSEVGRSW